MNKVVGVLYVMTLVSLLPTSSLATELNEMNYNGLQLAWVRLPSTSTTEGDTVVPKPKPKPKAAEVPTPVPIRQPVQPPALKQIELPASQPVPTPEVKVTPAPLVKPIPVAKPAQISAVKPAQQTTSNESQKFEWVIGLGIDFGGEVLGQVVYSDGSSASVNANKGVAINAGAIFPNGRGSAFSTQITLGYKLGGVRGSNGDVTWSAIPLEAIEFYRLNSLRTGLGISYYLNPQLSVNIPGSSYVDKYNNAIGIIAQVGWAPVREHYSLDLRYTSIKFQLSNVQSAPAVDGSVIGLYAGYRFY